MGKGMAFFAAFWCGLLGHELGLELWMKGVGPSYMDWYLSLFLRRRIFRAFPKQPKNQWNNKQKGKRLWMVHLMGIALGQPQTLADLASPPATP